MRLLVSLGLHAILLGLLGLAGGGTRAREADEPAPRQTIRAEIIDLQPSPRRSDEIEGSEAPPQTATPSITGRRSRTASPHRSRRSEGLVVTFDTSGHGAGAGHAGEGDGNGRGRGNGIGFGEGGGLPAPPAVPRPPPPAAAEVRAPSLARPPRLVYPARNREVDDAELFVARVIVDHEGYVVGAKLVRGFGGRRDEQASDLIWRFRYAPALDDAGRPVRATIEQRFLVQ